MRDDGFKQVHAHRDASSYGEERLDQSVSRLVLSNPLVACLEHELCGPIHRAFKCCSELFAELSCPVAFIRVIVNCLGRDLIELSQERSGFFARAAMHLII